MEIKKKNGELRAPEALYEEAVDMLVEALDDLCEEEQLTIGNAYREMNNYNQLNKNEEGMINDMLDGTDPYEILRLGEDWDSSDAYFTFDGWDLNTTDDVWYDADPDDIARAILEGDLRATFMELRDIVDEYEEALHEVESYNPYREMCELAIWKYVNCLGDVTDLLQVLDKLVRNDDVWAEE